MAAEDAADQAPSAAASLDLMVEVGQRYRVGKRGFRASDQFKRIGPIQAHAALRRVHRFGDTQPEAGQMRSKQKYCWDC